MARNAKSIGSRLSTVVVVAVLSGVLTSVTFFLLNDFRQTVFAEQSRLRGSAAAFAAAAAPSVLKSDTRGALIVLRGIRELPELQYAAARDRDGNVVAEIGGATLLDGRDGALEGRGLLSMLSAETLSVTADIRDSGEVIGSLHLSAGISALRDRYMNALLTSLLFGLALMIITSLIARSQISRIIRPLGALAGEFADIGRRSDLTRRLKNDRSDEIGVLIDAFNDMFGHIEKRDTLLQRHRDTLEQTVDERTAELRVAKDVAESANAAKSDFLATMSHEIRTPMNGMMVMAEMLSAAALAPKHLRYAEIISRSGRGLLNIINDILDYSKIEAGMMTLESIPFSIDSLVEDAASLFAERAREKGLTIALLVDPAVPRALIGDPTRINQVITNLLNNALKFTESGGATIVVRCGHSDAALADVAAIEVHVKDTGIGIAADKLGQIFERFSQADQTITRKFGGTGLGLSISRKLVQAMGGSLAVDSAIGSGSDFHFSIELPVAEAAVDCTRLDGKRVLVLDANPVSAATLRDALQVRGATVIGSCAEAPDAVLVRAGEEHLAQLAGDVPVVLLRPFGSAGGSVSESFAGEIALPLSRGELEALARAIRSGDWEGMRQNERSRHAADKLPDLGHLKVLAVDDTAVNREVLGEALAGFGIVADMAESGPDAIEMARGKAFDVIFMDCSMPGMDGFEATAKIRALEQEGGRQPAFVVALTAHVTGPEAKRWSEAGMDAYVSKPFTIAQLAGVLEDRAGSAAADRDASDMPAATETSPQRPQQEAPLLSPDTLAMLGSLSGPSGNRLAAKVFGLFRSHAPQAFASLLESFGGAPEEAAKLAHALKSMCLSAGAQQAGMLCGAIEEMLKRGEFPAQEQTESLRLLLDRTMHAMDAHLGADEPAAAAG